MSIERLLLVVLAAAVGGAINAIAGGGTLVTFPALVALGIPSTVANATSTVALWPGALSSMLGYRRELTGARDWVVHFTAPSLLGGALGAWLLLHTSVERFDRIVPFLVLAATLLFALQPAVMRRLRGRRAGGADGDGREDGGGAGGGSRAEQLTPGRGPGAMPLAAFYLCQFAVGVYGGYFGAGIGILMLAVLGFMGFTNIHRMNGLKNWGAMCMNGVAALGFAASGVVHWPVALAMAVGGIAGGYFGALGAQRVSQALVRRTIVLVGLGAFVWLLLRSRG